MWQGCSQHAACPTVRPGGWPVCATEIQGKSKTKCKAGTVSGTTPSYSPAGVGVSWRVISACLHRRPPSRDTSTRMILRPPPARAYVHMRARVRSVRDIAIHKPNMLLFLATRQPQQCASRLMCKCVVCMRFGKNNPAQHRRHRESPATGPSQPGPYLCTRIRSSCRRCWCQGAAPHRARAC
jgi:hypothetical protein